jgi:DNA polymerase kappa
MDTLADIAVELGKDLERLQYSGKTVTVKYKVSFYASSTLTSSCIPLKVRTNYET